MSDIKSINKVLKRATVDPYNPTRMGRFDEKFSVPIGIGIEHYEMHEGDFFFIKTFIENTGANGSSQYFYFKTPNNGKEIHAKFKAERDVDTEISIYEEAVISGGTPIQAQNCYRASDKVATLTAFANPTVIELGNLMWVSRNGGGRNPTGVGLSLGYEIIAKENSIYLFQLTKRTTANAITDIDFFWYEHADS